MIGEFEYGISHSRNHRRYEEWLGSLVAVSRVLEIDRETASRYAEVRSALRKKGRPIPANDAWIAALALQHELALLSRDAHFDQVKGIHRVSW